MLKMLTVSLCIFLTAFGFGQGNAKCDALMIKGNKEIDSIGKPNFKKAVKIYSKILKIDPNYHQALYNRGYCYVGIGKATLAIRDFNKFINIAPIEEKKKIAQAYTNRGIIYRKINEFDKALKDYNKALEIDNEIPQAYYNRALIYKNQNNMNSACEDFHKAIELGMKNMENLKFDCNKK